MLWFGHLHYSFVWVRFSRALVEHFIFTHLTGDVFVPLSMDGDGPSVTWSRIDTPD